ncbi:hypothetical protein [Streptomyces spinosisporus]|uniref:Uncharacterized protein n=1 Tax=Streptomyces spinosisporus TaxID=2927582 RepID=A0ABS9XW77_9ACTN|nr:hypothetical protein [Streptomyces spinosisporus]MCI3246339.1 hypothetical protein [Streptomyces spinosisporus]
MTHGTSTPQAQPSPATEPWPDDVIARYETGVGAIVELIDGEHSIKGTCSGCPEHAQPWPFSYDPTCSGYRMDSYVKREATNWAQAHAEKCRALPRPTA